MKGGNSPRRPARRPGSANSPSARAQSIGAAWRLRDGACSIDRASCADETPSVKITLRHTDRVRIAVTIRLLAVVTALSLGWPPPPSYAAENTEPLASFSPRGTVKNVRQATARFVSPMVALGDPRLADAFDVDCPAQGHGRWADERDWVYDFTDDLPAGVRCKFTLRADLRALDGAPVAALHAYEFDTGGPAIRTSLPYQ